MQRLGYLTYQEIAEALSISVEQSRRLFLKVHKKFPGDREHYVAVEHVIPTYIKRVKMPELYRGIDYILQEGKITPQTINDMLEIAKIEVEDRPTVSKFLEESAKEKGILEED